MTAIVLLILFVIFGGVFACVIKVAAWLFQRTNISWGSSLICSGALHVVIYLAHELATVVGIPLSRGQSSFLVVLLQFSLCMWFFANHATSIDGLPLGLRGGAKLSGIVFLLLFAIVAVPQVVFKVI